ncbi:MAG: hypothetical protein A2283_02090 [Lentisphaerae bacterium RIFOXYA12_FULL_48_11]|nr:MAG: hypothetical protein A2283_02090 [Lentisphaerae bacterium RIFOXYA12_FULL_48_11]
MKIAIGTSLFAEEDRTPLERLEKAGIQVTLNPFRRKLTEDETIEFIRDVDGLIAGLEPLNRNVLSAAPHLKAIARVGSGMDNVDQVTAAEKGIKVSNTPEGPTDAVAEITVSAMLTLARRLIPLNETMHAGTWKKIMGDGLSGTTIFIAGFGRIGRRVSELLVPFRPKLIAYDPVLSDGPLPNGVQRVTLEEGLKRADIISLHVAGTARLIGPDEFCRMRDGVILLNSARGALVDEPALIAALDSGKVRSAWFDVFPEEPYSGPLIRYPQVMLTPHISSNTRQCRRDMESAAVSNILHDLGITI